MTSVLAGPSLALGVATASYQIEGASTADGRGPSIWDTFAARPGAVVDGSDGRVACGSYERLDEDLDLVKDLGVDLYRFSIAWPRVQPTGSGPANAAGLDFYERVVDGCLARGLLPLPTLYHWDLPQPLEDAGGWPVRDTAARLADYAGLMAARIGDRVDHWATLNEPWCSAFLGYAAGVHAPGRQDGDTAYAAAHHLLLGHALAGEAIRAAVPSTNVGIVLNLSPVWPDDESAAAGADYIDAVQNRLWLDALVDGRYPEVLKPLADEALVQPGDLEQIRGSAAWIGVNYYTPFRPTLADATLERHPEVEAYPGATPVSFVVREPRTDIGWEVDASGLEELLVDTHKRTGLPVLVTENGAAYPDANRDDQDRIDYLRDHVAATERARAAGADVRAYIVWTLLDNFEWAEGYTKTFGIVHIDPEDLTRTPKASYHWLAEHVASGSGPTSSSPTSP